MNNFKIRRKALRKILSTDQAIVLPGCTDALTARLIEEKGFKALFITGAGIANTKLGLADMGLITMNEVLAQLKYIAHATESVALCVDADTGYGNVLNVMRTVKELEAAGATGIMIEDQVFPKRCGHFSGKEVIPMQEMINKIKIAVDTRQDDNMVIIVRTDSIATHGLECALERAHYYREAGADVTFLEAPRTMEALKKIGELPFPQMANMIEGGKTPLVPLKDLDSYGFNFILYANSILRASILAIQRVLDHIKVHGDTMDIEDQMVSWGERQRIVGLEDLKNIEKKYS